MKDVLTIDREIFRLQIRFISFSNLKTLLEGLFVYIKGRGEKWLATADGKEVLYDLERKQTIIWAELQRRGKMDKNDIAEFQRWLYKKHEKKIY